MDTLKEVFEDWAEITSVKRLRGAILHAARIMARNGQHKLAASYCTRVKRMPRRMPKEAINYVLMDICISLDLM